MRLIWYVGFGSAIGGVARFLLGGAIQQRAGTGAPIGTFVVNVTGSLLLGFLVRYAFASPGASPEMRAMLIAGFCGGYTTFSAFSYETLALIQIGDYRRAMLYAVLSIVLSVAATFAGAMAGDIMLARRAP